MTEMAWMKSLCNRLNQHLGSERETETCHAECRKKLQYRSEIYSYTNNDEPEESDSASHYEIDMLVYEKRENGSWIPRVAIEGKLSVSTHDALTYSAKAATLVQVHPYLRYGVLIAQLNFIPWRLFRHGTHFDFMMTWIKQEPTTEEWDGFTKVIRDEIESSKKLQRLTESRRSKDKYNLVWRRLELC